MAKQPKAVDLSKYVYVKRITIKNYKCFGESGCTVDLNVPDGNVGSGLTILVGTNGAGKTSVLEALNMVMESNYTVQNRLSVDDFCHDHQELSFEAEFATPCTYKMPDIYRGSTFTCKGVRLEANCRNAKSPGKLLAGPIQTKSQVLTDDTNYTTSTGGGKEIAEYHRVFDEDRLTEPLNIFYFGKDRARQSTSGMFSTTTFKRITEDLNWKFLLGATQDEATKKEIQELADAYIAQVLALTNSNAGQTVIEDTKEFFGRQDLANIRLDPFNLQWPFTDAAYVVRQPGELSHIPIAKLGSGIEMVFTLNLLRRVTGQAKGAIIYLIDEPELSLHPQAQRKLLQLLADEAKTRQVVISTHSAHFVDPKLLKQIVRLGLDAAGGKITKHQVADMTLAGKIEEERKVFFRRHRDLFFTDRAIFVEGADDLDRYGLYCELNGRDSLIDHLVMMNGVNDVLAFESFCQQFGLKFAAIVDKDYAYERSTWATNTSKAALRKVRRFMDENGVSFDAGALDKAVADDLATEKLKAGGAGIEHLDVDGTQVWKIAGKNIYVLQRGEVKDYLDKDGNVVEEDREAKSTELKAIFKVIDADIN